MVAADGLSLNLNSAALDAFHRLLSSLQPHPAVVPRGSTRTTGGSGLTSALIPRLHDSDRLLVRSVVTAAVGGAVESDAVLVDCRPPVAERVVRRH